MSATPEEQAKTENVVKALQEKMAKRDAVSASPVTRAERAEQTYGPDARKTRDLIRQGRYVSLPVLAKNLAPFISDQTERHKLEAALSSYIEATREYFKVEERPLGIIDWLGGPNGQVPPLPESSPEHKFVLVANWHNLLRCVNELSKVGVVKPPRNPLGEPTAIELLVDFDEDTPQKAPVSWD